MNDTTTLFPHETGNLGEISVYHPEGTFTPSPASRLALKAIVDNQNLLGGTGIDWGTGSGCLAILAARIPAVKELIGLDISESSIPVARMNAQTNAVGDKAQFLWSDSYRPYAAADRRTLADFRGRTDFVLSNPPFSDDDDGFAYRAVVLRGAKDFLRPGGVVFLSIALHYGEERAVRLTNEVPGYERSYLLATTDLVPYEVDRPGYLHYLENYAIAEEKGGPDYVFLHPEYPETVLNARAALENFRKTGASPLTKWQAYLFIRRTDP